jgi:type III secretory pathway component EscU
VTSVKGARVVTSVVGVAVVVGEVVVVGVVVVGVVVVGVVVSLHAINPKTARIPTKTKSNFFFILLFSFLFFF